MSSNNTSRKILAIDPGTREMGVAVLNRSELEFYGVKTITDRKTPSSILLQANQIVYRLINLHRPDLLAIELPFIGYGNRSATLVALAREVAKLGRDMGLEIREVSPKTVKKIITGDGSATKRQTAAVLCDRFPELRIHLEQTHKYKEHYWSNMFDAVAVAVAVTQSC